MITLLNGDCLEQMKTIPDKSVDLIICDLPYGCLSNAGKPKITEETAEKYGRKRIGGYSGCAWDVQIDLEPFWTQVRRIRRNDNTPTLHFCTTRFGFDLYASNPSEFRYDLVWNKQSGVSFLQANRMPMRSHEMIYVFSKKGAYYNRVDITGDFEDWIRKRSEGGKTLCAQSVINNPKSYTRGGHPTEKPIDLYKFLLERYCPKDGTVLDPTFGSGNSGRAALALGFNYIGIEKDKKYFDKAKADLIPSDVPIITHVTD